LYCCIFVGINIIAIAWYRSVCNYYIGQTKITLLNNQLKLINKNRSGSENRTQHLIESSNLVPWTADPENHTFTYIGEQIVDMTGIAYETWVTSGFWLSHIYEDDRHILFKAINDIKSQRYVTIEYRIYGNNGDIMWLRNTISKSSYYSAEEEEAGRIIFQGFLTDITDQKRVFETLENARLTAEKASQMKSNFLASMSHELRTPLNSIIGFADIIRTIKLENNEKNIKEYSENILFSGKHLLDLINDILDYSKIEAGEFEIRLEPTPVADIFKACQKLLQNRAETSNISLFFKIPDDSLVINVDPVRIKQVLINLISNAIKFNRPNGKVALVYEINEEQELIFKVTDTGIGMKPEDLKVALEKFRQVDAARSRNQEGTGLGLSISKSLIELHGGTLSIKSIYGKGTQVSIIFPPHIIYIHNSSIAN
jgi:signal transduction histidine kinase